MLVDFDKGLAALADCPVISYERSFIRFEPSPIIFAEDNPSLAHEICHRLAGRSDFSIFETAIIARDRSEDYEYILNLLYDWYHEFYQHQATGYLYSWLMKLWDDPTTLKAIKQIKEPKLREICDWYIHQVDPATKGIKSPIDLVLLADKIWKEIPPQQAAAIMKILDKFVGRDMVRNFEYSNYYMKTVAKYDPIISALTDLWKRNKYKWINYYYGEIDWKNLIGTYMSQWLTLPVFRLFMKKILDKDVFLLIDRSSSTMDIKTPIMDTAIIITESLRRCKVPISIMEVGCNDKVINKIDQPLKFEWFTPEAHGDTYMGKLLQKVKGATANSYLLIVTDGEPSDERLFVQMINRFPGQVMNFVIGSSFGRYYSMTNGRAISVEPNTIIREMVNENTLD
jgi:hypothetical protein